MKDFVKKIFVTLGYICLTNCFLFIGHIWALFGVAFNDTGVQYNSVIEALPTILFGIAPITIGTIIFLFVFKRKKDFNIPIYLIIQAIIVILWVMYYVYNYIPNSFLKTTLINIETQNKIDDQTTINNQAISELSNNEYTEIENITTEKQNIIIYINKNNSTIVLKYINNNTTNYGISTIEQINLNLINSRIKYSKINSNYTTIMDYDNNLYICLNPDECSKIKREDLELYDNERVSLGYVYYKMLNESVITNENKYIPNDIKYLQIEKNDNLITITEESLKNITIDYNERFFDYGWVIKRNGEQILSRAIRPDKLYLNFDEIDEKYFSENGNYEIYLNIYFSTDLYDSGYIKASNSVFWTN